ncbi:hypothetical protein ABT255_09910 [Streptomyces mirabilis]|uniref:hypothetical protein n=1 Tax=Streptomyces mirabilis TaxID=68239 RepID=UPI00331CA2E8
MPPPLRPPSWIKGLSVEGPHGAADHELLSGLLRIVGDWEKYIKVDQDDEAAVGRVEVSMLRVALGDGLGTAPTA